jgi:RimJ/RimL family protein N-acetyltransferase
VLRLRALTGADVPLLDSRAHPEINGEFNDFGVPARGIQPLLGPGVEAGSETGYLVVDVDDQVAGSVTWDAVSYGPNEQSRCPAIGIALRPEWRGRGHGTVAQRMLADYLFATLPANRVEAQTDLANVPEQTALARAGFTREGVLRGAQWRAGTWHDLVVYSRLRADP